MKIKELVQESIWDTMKGYAQGGKTGAQAAQQQAAGQKELTQFVDIVFRKWNEYAAQTGRKTADDALAWANKFYKTDKITYKPGDDKPASIKLFLTKATQDYKAGTFNVPSKTAQNTSGAPGDVELVSDDPYVTLKMQGTLYSHPGGGAEGWVITKTGRKVNKFMQAMLNKAHDQLVGQA